MKSKILVIDERDIALLIKINLEKAGFEVVMLNNSREVLEKVKREKPDAITLDIMMPEMDGFQVLKLLKSDPETKDIPVILVSVVSQLFKEQGFRLGAVDFVTKPISFDKLYKVVDNIVSDKYKENIKKILIVDDEPEIADLIKNVLKSKGYDAVVAYNGTGAVDLIKKEKFDLVILDLYMPVLDGFQVLQKLKTEKETADIPVIVLTGNDMKGYREKCLFLGANQYMTKPFSADVLMSEISKQLQRITK